MSESFLGEIRAVAFSFAPSGWALCDGSLLSISQNTALFSLLGNTYGGDGISTFALPDLRGRVAVGQGQGPGLGNYVLGAQAGTESYTLQVGEIGAHTHGYPASANNATNTNPAKGPFAQPDNTLKNPTLYATSSTDLAASAMVTATGGGQAHENRQPYLTVSSRSPSRGFTRRATNSEA